MKTFILRIAMMIWLGIVLTFWAGLAAAQDTSDPASKAPPPAEITLDITAETDADIAIETRLEKIFGQDETLSQLSVGVMEGVVTLSGEVPNESYAKRAIDLAEQVDGVLTVNDGISRTLALSDNLTPMYEGLRNRTTSIVRAAPLLAIAFLTFLMFVLLGHLLAKANQLWGRIAPNPFLAEIIAQAVRIIMIVLGVVTALNMLGAKELMATILGGAGVIGLAIGFAVRDTIENYISSIMLSVRQPFRANDHVRINDHEGKVVRLTSRATILMTMDGNHLRIPNATVFKAIILNFSRNPDRRFSFDLGVDADDDPIAAMDTVLAKIQKLDFLLDDPGPSASIKEVGGSNIVLSFKGWIDQTQTSFGKARSHAIRAATSVLVDEGFTMPEPIYRLKLDERMSKLLADDLMSKTQMKAKAESKAKPKTKPGPGVVDMTPETHLDKRVNEERVLEGKKDLLDSERPVE